jgi:hypothetical protein
MHSIALDSANNANTVKKKYKMNATELLMNQDVGRAQHCCNDCNFFSWLGDHSAVITLLLTATSKRSNSNKP